jgi:hypothetical protein
MPAGGSVAIGPVPGTISARHHDDELDAVGFIEAIAAAAGGD